MKKYEALELRVAALEQLIVKLMAEPKPTPKKRPVKPYLSKAEREIRNKRIAEAYKSGWTMSYIAKQEDLSHEYVRQILAKEGAYQPQKKLVDTIIPFEDLPRLLG